MRQSMCAPDDLITPAQRALSERLRAANSAGVDVSTSAPCLAKNARTCGSASTASVSLFRRAITASGVPAGAINPYHDSTTKPGTPASIIVGYSGQAGDRFAPVTA